METFESFSDIKAVDQGRKMNKYNLIKSFIIFLSSIFHIYTKICKYLVNKTNKTKFIEYLSPWNHILNQMPYKKFIIIFIKSLIMSIV